MKRVLAYTVHGAASRFLYRILREASAEFGVEFHALIDERYRRKLKEISWRDILEGNGSTGCYGPICIGDAEPCMPTDLDAFSVVLQVRDPRDVMTSLYYSFLHGKGGRSRAVVDRRRVKEMGIDEFVLERAPERRGRYEILCGNLLDHEDVHVLRYEQMVTDYGAWLSSFLSLFAGLTPVPRKVLGIFPAENDFESVHRRLYRRHRGEFRAGREHPTRHRRRVEPGDHRKKLAPETIAALNGEFAEILTALGYD